MLCLFFSLLSRQEKFFSLLSWPWEKVSLQLPAATELALGNTVGENESKTQKETERNTDDQSGLSPWLHTYTLLK